jgi:predicted RNA-binding Zn-ribbon protein involved in translation (DUF1610 family)
MASKIIGRTVCPECGFEGAHVKESEKCLYRYCPECGSQHHARSERQRVDLEAKTRAVDGLKMGGGMPLRGHSHTPTPTPTHSEPDATPKPTPTPTPKPLTSHSRLFGVSL